MRAPVFKPVRSRRAFQEVLTQIADAIRAGDLRVGDRLPSEREMAAVMEVSRPTVREALRILADSGVLGGKPDGKGTYVTSDFVSPGVFDEGLGLRISDVWPVLHARRLVEPRVAQLAAFTATEADFEAMQETIDDQRAEPDKRLRFIQLDQRFHLIMARATRNDVLVEIVMSLIQRLEIAWDMIYRRPHEPERALALHDETLQALMGRDPDQIDIAMDHHLSFLEEVWEEESGRAPPRQLPGFLLSRDREKALRS